MLANCEKLMLKKKIFNYCNLSKYKTDINFSEIKLFLNSY